MESDKNGIRPKWNKITMESDQNKKDQNAMKQKWNEYLGICMKIAFFSTSKLCS